MPDAGDPTHRGHGAPLRQRRGDRVLREPASSGPRPPTSSGFDTMWLTEHHFQYEGYEVLPNLIMFGMHLAHAHQGAPLRADVQRGAAVAPAAPGRGLRPGRHHHRRAHGVRRRPRHRAARGVGARHRGRQRRQRDVGRARPHQPRDLRGGDGGHQARLVPGALQLPRQALRVPARRRARPWHHRERPHPGPQAAAATSTSTSRSPRRRPSSTCRGPVTRPSTGCRTPTARSRSGTATPRSARRSARPVGPGEDRCLVLNLHVGQDPRAGTA